MSLNLIMNTATSGLMTAQTQLRVVSDNVSNVNTPGYVRKIADQVAYASNGIGAGVEVARIRLATDRFLQAASLNAEADAGRYGVRAELYDRIQSLMGDPGGSGGILGQVNSLFSAFSTLSDNAISGPYRQQALSQTQVLFDEATRIAGQIQAVREDADARISAGVARANELLSQIEAMNVEISRASVAGGDTTGAEAAQASLIDQLSGIMDIRVSVRPVGGVQIRTGTGMLLAGDGHATLEYQRAGAVNAETAFDDIWLTEPRGAKRSLLDHLGSGELRGLVELRDQEAPAASQRLSELVTRIADELNRAHNASTSVPAPNSLTGRNIGTSFEAAIAGFSGTTNVAVTNGSGAIVARAEVVFSGGTMTVNGTAATPANFLSVLNAELGGAATATFNNGVLSIQATNTANGVVIADDPASPSSKTGRGFSHFFGLNDLIRSDRPALYDTGLTAASPHGFTAGETISFRFAGPSGARLRDITVQIPPGATMADLVSALNDPMTGVGRMGTFALDAQGRMGFTPLPGSSVSYSVVGDTTTQTTSSVSLSELFGLGRGVRSSRLDGFSVRSDILAQPSRLALARLDLNAAPGTSALSVGDGRGALTLADAGERTATFDAAGSVGASSMSITRYVSELAGDIGGRAAANQSRADAATAVRTEARQRQASHEGVNLDEELVNLTTYQQAFNASARMIQAAKDLYDVLLGMVQ
ncbi:flagellar hook-associated protein FlgK [Brevundimonas aveniformis]|uniref:flagellar hook-associated protein FlgK n=1 Tax=Brevundimonas aveniformis TaxID=370977 RepID=UPI00248FA6C8|nr:flagellar hook-associated protein FlgK [Brevundimonas aveniformis]